MEIREKEELLDKRNSLKNDLMEIGNCNGCLYSVHINTTGFQRLRNSAIYIPMLISFIEKEIEVIDKKLGI